jgi:YVTN family beta-propeller protein
VIDTNNNTVVATIPVGQFPGGVAFTPDGTHAYVTNSYDDTVSVIDTASNSVLVTIPIGTFPVAVAITPDGTYPFEHDDRPHPPLAYVTNACEVCFDSNGNVPGGTVSVIDTTSNSVVATIPVGKFPVAVAITPDRTHPFEHDDRPHPPLAYVTNDEDNTVSVIDTASNQVVATVPVGNGADAVAFATVTPSHRSEQ